MTSKQPLFAVWKFHIYGFRLYEGLDIDFRKDRVMAQISSKRKGFSIQISPNNLRAFLVVRPDQNHEPVTREDLLDLLAEMKLPQTPDTLKRVDETLASLQKGLPREPILLAEGIPAQEPVDASFIWNEIFHQKSSEPADDDAGFNFYERHKIVTVEVGTVLGEIHPPVPGKNGVDVFGTPIKPSYTPAPIKLGENVELGSDKRTIKSTSSGQVIIQNDKISVSNVLNVTNNVDFETGNIDSTTSVCIRGNVCDLFRVQSKQHITVQGMVEAAFLQADGDISIIGGVKGRDKAFMEAQGNISAKFINSIYVEAQGTITICKEAINSVILAGDTLDIRFGSLIGGHAFALKNVRVKSLGSPAGVKTVVGVGMNPLIYQQIFELEKNMRKVKEVVEKIQTSIEPLLKHIKQLTPDQREKATELMFKSQEMQTQIDDQKKESQSLLDSLPPYSEIEIFVSGRIFPKTQIFIADRYVTIQDEIKGPAKVVLRQVQGVKELLLINQITGDVRSFISGRLEPETAAEVLNLPPKPKIKQPGAKTIA
jgi:uncharacterized protein (DUF342 family)